MKSQNQLMMKLIYSDKQRVVWYWPLWSLLNWPVVTIIGIVQTCVCISWLVLDLSHGKL